MTNLPSTLNGKLGFAQPLLESLGFGFSGGWVESKHYVMAAWFVFWLLFVWFWPNTQEWMRRYRPVLETITVAPDVLSLPPWRPTRKWAAITAALGIASVLGLSSVTEFLYFQF